MKKRVQKKEQMFWRIKLFLFLCLIGQALFFALFPIIREGQISYLSSKQKEAYKQILDVTTARDQKKLIQYERTYNKYLTREMMEESTAIAQPSNQYFKQTNEMMGFLSSPIIGLEETTIGYPTQSAGKEFPFTHQLASSLPEEGRTATCMIIELKRGWEFQALVTKLQRVKKGDSFFLETHYGKEEYKVLDHPSFERKKSEKNVYFTTKGNHVVIRYSSPIKGIQEIILKKGPKIEGKRLIVRRPFLSYSMAVISLIVLMLVPFLLLIFSYRRSIRNFYTEKERVRQTSRKTLYTLLQGTKAYFLIVGLAAGMFLVFICYVYHLF